MSTPRITIIMPNLNQARFIERSICSVLDQGYENLEFIVIDGGSTDGSQEIIEHYRDEITLFHQGDFISPSEAANHGLQLATGDIVGILNSDDLYLPGTLHAVANEMANSDNVDWIVGHSLRIDDCDRELGHLHASAPANMLGYLMHDSGLLPPAATFYGRSALLSQGMFRSNLHYAYEYELGCRMISSGSAPAVLPQVLSAQREQPAQRTVAQTIRQGIEFIEAAEMHSDRLPLSQRYALWRNCDERRRIYSLAEAEVASSETRKVLWQRLLRRPWWLASEHYRQTLLHGPRTMAQPGQAA